MNVLLPENSSDWIRSAVPLVLAQDLSTSRTLLPTVVESDSDVYRAGAQQALRITIQGVSARAEVDAVITNTATQQNVRTFAPTRSRGSGSDLIGELDALAKEIDPSAVEFSTRSETALKLFSVGLSTTDSQIKAQRLKEAIGSDLSFGLAYVVLLELLSSEHEDAKTILKSGEEHRSSFVPLDKARFDIIRSQLLRSPAEDQIRDAENLLKLAPNEPDVLASLASALFRKGRVAEAERAIDRALVINPGKAALRQNLAMRLFENRQFMKAEQVLTAVPATPAVLPQIAFCALLGGQTKRADQVFDRFLKSISNPNARMYLSASWQAYEGHLDAAIGQLETAHFNDPQLTMLARSQVILWYLMAKRYQEAKAMAGGATPVATLLASGASSAEAWSQKVDTVPDDKSREGLKGYGLYLYGFYAQSADVWKKIDESAGGTDIRARTMLAASLRMSGRADQASKIPIQAFFPNFDDYYGALSFNTLRRLLGQAG